MKYLNKQHSVTAEHLMHWISKMERTLLPLSSISETLLMDAEPNFEQFICRRSPHHRGSPYFRGHRSSFPPTLFHESFLGSKFMCQCTCFAKRKIRVFHKSLMSFFLGTIISSALSHQFASQFAFFPVFLFIAVLHYSTFVFFYCHITTVFS